MLPVRFRLVPYSLRSGYENMAIDESLIAWFERDRTPILRLYGWIHPCISLGRYQSADCLRLDACRESGVGVVRRITGGGAIYHDHELTYSLVCDERHICGEAVSFPESFGILNRFIIGTYRQLGLSASYAKDAEAMIRPRRRDNFCFSGFEEFDIVVNGKKIGGNAQRRSGSVIFQHGSVPFHIDTGRIMKCFSMPVSAGGFTCIHESAGREITIDEAAAAMIHAFSEQMGLDYAAVDIREEEKDEVDTLLRSKYDVDDWNLEGRERHGEIGAARLA